MARRKRIGLHYNYDENWIGGTYYIENLIKSLNTLPDNTKPHIVIITKNRSDFNRAKENTSYPYLSFQLLTGEANRFARLINKVTQRLFKKKYLSEQMKNLDVVFPYYESKRQTLVKKKIFWIPDFQEHFSPEFFKKEDITDRKNKQLHIEKSSLNLILSSNDALNHFKTLYPQHRVKVDVLPFAVSHPLYKHLLIKPLLKKYELPERYFICPNQFWKHKNQLIVLKAVNILKEKAIDVIVAFTGNTSDHRNPHYFNELNTFVKENKLEQNIKFLGFIDRLEQLQLMKHSIAIIQPSLFEGWSTVIEDAKAMNKYLIASNINIHQEQLVNSTALFFEPLNEVELSEAINETLVQPALPKLLKNANYKQNIREFGSNFLKIVSL